MASFSQLAERIGARIAPLDTTERLELLRLRRCELHHEAEAYGSERDELAALRAALQRELEKARALTQDEPNWYSYDPVVELLWRRPHAEAAAKAALTAAEEKARLEREGQEERLAGLRAQAAAKKRAAELAAVEEEERARLKREAEEERRTYRRQAARLAEQESARLAEEERAYLAEQERARLAEQERARLRREAPPPAGIGSQASGTGREPVPGPLRALAKISPDEAGRANAEAGGTSPDEDLDADQLAPEVGACSNEDLDVDQLAPEAGASSDEDLDADRLGAFPNETSADGDPPQVPVPRAAAPGCASPDAPPSGGPGSWFPAGSRRSPGTWFPASSRRSGTGSRHFAREPARHRPRPRPRRCPVAP